MFARSAFLYHRNHSLCEEFLIKEHYTEPFTQHHKLKKLYKVELLYFCVIKKEVLNKKTYEKRFEKLIQLLSSNGLLPYVRQNNNNTFSRIRKMPCHERKKNLSNKDKNNQNSSF